MRITTPPSSMKKRSHHKQIDRKIRTDNPAAGVKKPPVRKLQRFLSGAELGNLADALKGYVDGGGNIYPASAIRLLVLTGARRSEIRNLRWREVDLERGLLVLPDSKTGAKVIHLSRPAVEILEKLPRLNANEFVIVGGKVGTSYQALNAVWEDVRRAAGRPSDHRKTPWPHSGTNDGPIRAFGR